MIEIYLEIRNEKAPYEQVALIYAGINGFLDDVPVADVKEFVVKLRSYIRNSVPQFITSIQTEKKLSPENEEVLKTAIAAVNG